MSVMQSMKAGLRDKLGVPADPLTKEFEKQNAKALGTVEDKIPGGTSKSRLRKDLYVGDDRKA